MATIPFDSAELLPNGSLVVRFNGDNASAVDYTGPIVDVDLTSAVVDDDGSPITPAGGKVVGRIVESGHGPFFAELLAKGSGTDYLAWTDASSAVTISLTSGALKDSASTPNTTAATTDSYVRNRRGSTDGLDRGFSSICSATNIKSYLGIAGSTYDTALGFLARAATKFIEDYTGREYQFKTRYEVLSGDESESISLKHSPVFDVHNIWRINADGVGVTSIARDCWRFDPSSAEVRLSPVRFGAVDADRWGYIGLRTGVTPDFGSAWRGVLVEYTAGYLTDDIPEDLRQACIEVASVLFRHGRRDQGLQSETIDGYSWTAASKEEAFMLADRLLSGSRRMLL